MKRSNSNTCCLAIGNDDIAIVAGKSCCFAGGKSFTEEKTEYSILYGEY
ncbi:hypothetical protein [Mixta theicola]|nr:hypothetical protein [Mixta theicola]